MLTFISPSSSDLFCYIPTSRSTGNTILHRLAVPRGNFLEPAYGNRGSGWRYRSYFSLFDEVVKNFQHHFPDVFATVLLKFRSTNIRKKTLHTRQENILENGHEGGLTVIHTEFLAKGNYCGMCAVFDVLFDFCWDAHEVLRIARSEADVKGFMWGHVEPSNQETTLRNSSRDASFFVRLARQLITATFPGTYPLLLSRRSILGR